MATDDDCLGVGFEASIPDPTFPFRINELSNNATTPAGGRFGGIVPSTGAGLEVTANTPEEKIMRRKMANRRSAKESRARRRHVLSSLQMTVDSLSAENKAEKKINYQLRSEVQELRRQLVIANSQVGGAPSQQSTMSLALTPSEGQTYHHDLTCFAAANAARSLW